MKGLIGPDSVTKFETKANLLKYHPLVMVLLLDTCYYNIYIQNQSSVFQQLETQLISWIEDFSNGTTVLYCDS